MTTKPTLLQFAFDNFTSDADGLTAEEAMALSDSDWDDRVSVWLPFEDFDRYYVTAQIEQMVEALEQFLAQS